MEFTDSLENNLEVVRELLTNVPAGGRVRAKRAASDIENVFTKLQKDNPRDPAVALGAAFAIFFIADRLIKSQGDDTVRPSGNLIHLLK